MRKFENGLTEAGKLKADMRNHLRTGAVDTLTEAGYALGTNGSFAVQIAEVDGTPVYAKVALSIGTKNPFEAIAVVEAATSFVEVDAE